MSLTIRLSDVLGPSQSVEIHDRLSDFPPAGFGDPVKKAKTNKDGDLEIDGLIPFGRYWIVGEDRTVAYDFIPDIGKNDDTTPGSGHRYIQESARRAAAFQKQAGDIKATPEADHEVVHEDTPFTDPAFRRNPAGIGSGQPANQSRGATTGPRSTASVKPKPAAKKK